MDRQATPPVTTRTATRDDIPFLAEMDCLAAQSPFERPFWEALLEGTGTAAIAFLEAMFQADGSNWGLVEDFLILEIDGHPVATCAVFRPGSPSESNGPINLLKLDAVAASLGWAPSVKSAFRAAYQEMLTSGGDILKPQAEMIVETVAVAPAHRDKGLGRKLMEAAFETAKAKGAQSLGIMVIHGNDTARTLYEKFFEPYATYHPAYFDNKFPGLTKYRATLTP